MTDLDGFGDPEHSTPLPEALIPDELEQYSTEELRLYEIGITPMYYRKYKELKPKGIIVNKVGVITKTFFKWYLSEATLRELETITKEVLKEDLKELLSKAIEAKQEELKNSINPKTFGSKEPTTIEDYIREREEIITMNTKLAKETYRLQNEIVEATEYIDKIERNLDPQTKEILEKTSYSINMKLRLYDILVDIFIDNMIKTDKISEEDFEFIKEDLRK